MTKRVHLLSALFIAAPTLGLAYGGVVPREETPGIEQDYTVRAQVVNAAPAGAPVTGEAAVIEKWLNAYDAAFNAKDLDTLGTYYHPEVTIYEGGGIDNGWAKYRDGHLGPELKAFENLQFAHANRQITMLPDGKAAYVVSSYTLKAKMGDRVIDSGGLETLVLLKGTDGGWKIRHSHTSSRPRRPAQKEGGVKGEARGAKRTRLWRSTTNRR